MFTGIIKELGKVTRVSKKADICELAVRSQGIYKSASIGDSISVNGACLTVTGKKRDELFFDVMEETLRKTALGGLRTGDPVNLEDSLK
ncbi:MAG: riboflavin synthase, partial [Candidatus Omnitrophota bacterium]|nr:riboflavin synthase [Candidatus Omnitrophota bacterium]